MEEQKYYFVFYKCKKWGWKPESEGGQSTGIEEMECQTIINQHPIQFQLDCNEKYGKIREGFGGYKGREDYKVINWIEITKDEFDKYHDKI